ncbi:MAG: beta-ketoacyl-ACP synthase II [Dehalococcoidia bacterium]|jgi:3-oxoacyl-[acyl-carrier-protein] synthase II|nr:beta-ketoacyl-[acyl-carrier-protein] synthase II [Chloroflexota bacterium]MDP6057029.1 beta-ketoacyl-ACP synthase II [Dehalococcoidia bacterium]MDP7485798.1 beta-ketoacyl-ACP synthase II [Dehalococcoidia bacterium]|tara:strand:+ start:5149 stop:6390 length:1242 start_codon:yes stop_codon:yes gene_type:complete
MADRVVVTGLGLVTPVGSDQQTTWESLLEGKSGIDYISLFDASGFESQIAAEVDDWDAAPILGRKEARRLDRFSQFACVAALEALEQAGIDMASEDPDRVGVFIGSGVGGIITITDQHKILLNRGPKRVSPFLVPMMLGDMASGQVSMMIGAKGPNFSTVSACATGTDSIGEGLEMIRRGRTDVVIAGGTEAAVCEIGVAGFNSCMALSTRNDDPQAASRPFDSGRDGFVLGEGAGLVILESLEHAEKRGANVLAELAGYGASSDAHHVTQPHPEGEGAARAMKWAIQDADLVPENVDYINAHGTSTPLNDKFETIAMKRMYGDHADKLAISSTKSMTGHLLGAAGGIEAAFSVLTIKNRIIPPTINIDDPDPECDLNYVPNKAVKQEVNVAMSNSLGFGGHNASLVFKSFQQ